MTQQRLNRDSLFIAPKQSAEFSRVLGQTMWVCRAADVSPEWLFAWPVAAVKGECSEKW